MGKVNMMLREKLYTSAEFWEFVQQPENAGKWFELVRADYLEAGTKLVWVVYPDEKVVYGWRMADEGRMLVQKVDINGVLDGDDVPPGFKLGVRDVFPK